MSSVYVVEPPTKGKVVITTTIGPIDIELWPKEAPKAVRNFVQLCLEGYYDNTIFHRVIASFLVQGGDPTATGTGGESIYGPTFADEFHSRLRFSHRGIVACANAGSAHSNGSQFFMTLDRCEWLDRKNTIFGKVTGDSIYNLLKLGDTETDGDDRPLEPHKVISVEVLWNPFEDIVPRQVIQKTPPHTEERDQKNIAVKKLSVLSFGEEVEEEEKELATRTEKIKSIHDVLDDPRFLKEPQKEELDSEEVQRRKDAQRAVREALSSKKADFYKDRTTDNSDPDQWDDDESKFDERMRMQILRKRREIEDNISRETTASDKPNQGYQVSSPRSDAEDTEERASKVEKLSMKKKGIGSEARAERMAKADVDLQLLGKAEQERHMKKQKKRRLHGREEDTLAKLLRFQKSIATKLSAPSAPDNSKSGGNEDDDESGWLANRLTFVPDSGKDGMTRKEDTDDYVVHDPLLAKGKEKFNKMQAKQKRREREWAGRSIT